MPYAWWTYQQNLMSFVKIDFLVWTTHKQDIVPKVLLNARFLIVHNKMIDRFMSCLLTNQLCQSYNNNNNNNMFDQMNPEDEITVPMFQNCATLWNEVKESFDLDDDACKPAAMVQLPFRCTQIFHNPFVPGNDYPGYGLRLYQHPCDGNRRFTVFHVSCQGVEMAQETTQGDHTDADW